MAEPREFQELAELHGIQLDYYDVQGQQKHASTDSLIRVLQCLGVPIDGVERAGDLLREAKLARARRVLEPVCVSWQPSPTSVTVRLPSTSRHSSVACRLTTEQGDQRAWSTTLDELAVAGEQCCEGVTYLDWRLPIANVLPTGYHRLDIETDGRSMSSLLLAAPRAACSLPATSGRRWGVFLPLYALHSHRSCGAGDFSDLESLNEWVAELGGSLVASLPLLASFYGQEGDESPYRPASRLFWNELFLDLAQIPELASSLGEAPIRLNQADQLRAERLVDYAGQMQWKRRLIEPAVRRLFEQPSPRRDACLEFAGRHPELGEYAKFRAAEERHGRPWMTWPQPHRDGRIPRGSYDEAAYHYHLYVQWLLDAQLTRLADQARARGLTWYLDLPLGVHPDGYDAWRHRDVFALDASGGAPPDTFFTQGQCWGFPPFHPARLREQGYRYFLSMLRAHLRFAGLLRIDHVMGLHRLFWVPSDMPARDGVYVRYPADEHYAILTLESHRHQSRIIGENLGTVPPEVNAAMDEHNIGRLYVLQYAMNDWDPDRGRPLPEISPNSVASLNTHDMPPFASYWRGLDTDDRFSLGLMDSASADWERGSREALRKRLVAFLRQRGLLGEHSDELEDILAGCLAFLAASSADILLVNLEDLWLETAPQNTPGTTTERINWRLKAQRSFDEFSRDGRIRALLERVNALRRSV